MKSHANGHIFWYNNKLVGICSKEKIQVILKTEKKRYSLELYIIKRFSLNTNRTVFSHSPDYYETKEKIKADMK